MDEAELRAFALARVEEDETLDRARGLELWSRTWERDMVDHGSVATVRLIASRWSGHVEYRAEWAPEWPS